MRISKLVFAIATVSIFAMTSCGNTNPDSTEEHGHEHDADGGHMQHETVEQEEFQVEKDSSEIETEMHMHTDGGEHHGH
jgi:hypothetical protein